MNANEAISMMTLDEKISLLTGTPSSMYTASLERLGIQKCRLADGPHGIRSNPDDNCTHFPNLCCIGASWDVDMIYKMGEALGDDCAEHGVDMLLGPGINIKRHILCGRNFEYISEDPCVSGEMAAGYINGLQSKGIAASLKHFAANSQEINRGTINAEIDEKTLRELYLKGFEIAVKKSAPESVMCAYNKINAIWCSENKYLLTDILKKEWGYDGFVISDWGAVHNASRACAAGLDLHMPANKNIVEEIKQGLSNNTVSESDIDAAVLNVLKFMLKERPSKCENYDRRKQHAIAREAAASGIVLLKNDGNTLPLTKEKYGKIAVIGGFAENPLTCGQGSAEVFAADEYVENPLDELRKQLPDVEIEYKKVFDKKEFSPVMLWPTLGEYKKFIENKDAVVIFVGSMESEDTENFDRRCATFNPNYEMFINEACGMNKKVVVVIQSGSAMILGEWNKTAGAVVEMWLGGEAAGGAIADVLCGKVNPSGKLTETFPNVMRRDLDYPGKNLILEYSEKLDVGYRYYDKHPEEICYPFGHGLSYTEFEYSNLVLSPKKDCVEVSFTVKNTGDYDGAEVVQIYVNDPVSTVTKPIKELKAFKKLFIKKGAEENVTVSIPYSDLAYYNVMLKSWITENGEYNLLIGSSSRDIRLEGSFVHNDPDMPYSLSASGECMIG